jgi:predicted dehydrogenase
VTVRVGIIGTGFGARVVAPAFEATEGCMVVDVVSPRDERATAELCRRDGIDLISVHSPPFLHGAHVRAAIETGRAVLCDKPFGLHAEESAGLLAAAEAAGTVHLVNFELRCDPMRRRLRDLVRDGVLGDIEHVSWTYRSAGTRVPLRRYGWLSERRLGGGWVGAWGSHAVDTLRWMAGEVKALAWAQCRTTIRERPDATGRMHAVDAEDGFTAQLELAGGITVVLDGGFAYAASTPERLVVAGSLAVAELIGGARITVRRADGTRDEIVPDPPENGNRHVAPMRAWCAIVHDIVETGTLPPEAPTFTDGLACDRVLDQIRRYR